MFWHRLPAPLPVIALALILLGLAACSRGEVAAKSACDDLVITEDGLTREVYLPCAGEILAAMDALRPDAEAAVEGDKEARKRARRAYRALRKLVKKAGGKDLLEEWRDGRLTDLNAHLWKAYSNYHDTTLSPNRYEFQNATRHHDAARAIYDVL